MPRARTTLAYANEHRPWRLYRTVFENLVQVCHGEARAQHRKFRFQHPLLSLDSTVIPVCLKMFEWAKYTKTKGAVKVHTVLDNRSIMPQYAVVTDGKTADVKVARGLKFEPQLRHVSVLRAFSSPATAQLNFHDSLQSLAEVRSSESMRTGPGPETQSDCLALRFARDQRSLVNPVVEKQLIDSNPQTQTSSR